MRPGDVLRSPTDWRWWSAPYKYSGPMWRALTAQAKRSDAFVRSLGESVERPLWNDVLASGQPAELSHEMTVVADELARIQESGTDDCPPYVWGPGGMPIPNPKCPGKVAKEFCDRYPDLCNPKKLPLPRFPKLVPEVPWWALALLFYVMARKRK